MKCVYVYAVIFVVTSAQIQPDYETLHPYPIVIDSYPEWYVRLQQQQENEASQRQRRDFTLARRTTNGQMFGGLGSNDIGLYGKAGYQHNFKNGHRGILNGQLYGSRTITPYGSGTSASGAMNKNTAASVDVTKTLAGGPR